MKQTNKNFQITLTDNNEITAHIPNSQLQEKFFQLLEIESKFDEEEYLVELFELENLKNIHKIKFATKIVFDLKSSNEHIDLIDLTDFVRLKSMCVICGDIFEKILLPENLKEIIFSKDFNSQLSNLPSNLSILNLQFSHNYNCVLDNLPLGLKELYLNSNYSHPLNYLPESLEKLFFNCKVSYAHNFDNLPNNIKELQINKHFLNKINKFPTNLKKLFIGKQIGSIVKDKKEIKERLQKIVNFNDKIKIE